MKNAPRVLIVGGAVAGASCAIQLRKSGVEVLIVEKESFPRAKVCGCCIGGSGMKLLAQLGVASEVIAAGVATNRWHGFFDGRKIELPIDQGVAISREVLDPILLKQAEQLGAMVQMPCEAVVRNVSDESVRVELKSSGIGEVFDCDVVVIASGLRSGDAGGTLQWIEKPNGPFGVSFSATCDAFRPGTISMACTDDGYVGIVVLADGRIDVAAALRSGADAAACKPVERVHAILQQCGVQHDWVDVSSTMTTAPLRRTRRSGHGRVLAIGDAAGYVEPFTGEGMTWAMKSGIASAQLIADQVASSQCLPGPLHEDASTLSSLGDQWARKSQELLKTEKRTCRVVTSMLRSSAARMVAAKTLAVFPGLARPLLDHLAK